MGPDLAGLPANGAAEGLGQGVVPGAGQGRFDRVREADLCVEQAAGTFDCRRAVVVRGRRHAETFDAHGAVAALRDHLDHLIDGELVEELLPERVVLRDVREKDGPVFIGDALLRSLPFDCRRGTLVRVCDALRHGEVGGFLREGTLPVGTGQDCQALVGVIKEVLDLRAGLVVILDDLCFWHGIGIRLLDVPDGVGHFDLVSALVEYPGLFSVRIVRRHIIGFVSQCQGLALAWLQQSGLAVGRQLDLALLDATLRVRRGEVDLNHVLAGPFSGVGDLHLDGHVGSARVEARHLPGEVRVGQAVAKGVLDLVRRERLEVPVTDVDALFIVDKVLAEDARERAVVLVVAEVAVRRVVAEAPGNGVGQFSGGVHFAGQYIA